MLKKIMICFDGTWNTPHDEGEYDETDADTNVVKLYRSVLGEDRRGIPEGTPVKSPSVKTIKWYDEGVGTKWYDHIKGGAFGFGLSRNIREGYKFLIDHYDPGDEIYIFGFSRGAYTARSLVGLIRNSGLLKKQFAPEKDADDNAVIMDAYQLYRNRDGSADTPFAVSFRSTYAHEGVRIKFLGVWDTVGALGIPIKSVKLFNSEQYKFHDTELSSIVENAYHAIAIDEHREDFEPTLWDPKEKPFQKMEQVWFVGAHGDVGGGYKDQPLSDITLNYMQDKAKLNGKGIEFDPAQEPPLIVKKYVAAKVTDSFNDFVFGLYKSFHAPYLRTIGTTVNGNERLHPTFSEIRTANLAYRPKNLGLDKAHILGSS
jgi:uncharacterized protein (DUF2235 family)